MQHPYDMPPRLRQRALRDQAGPISGRFGTTPSLRLLPLLILAAVAMLGFKLQVIVNEVAGETRLVAFVMEQSAAFAQAAVPGASNAAKPAAPAAPAAAPAAPAATPADSAAAPAAEGAAPAEADTAGGPPLPVNFDPANLTKSEIDTLQRLAERREFIERRERETEAKEGLLKAAEARIDGKIAQLQDLEKNIQGLLKQYDAQKQEEIDQLVTIYSAMKPKDAARIFDTLEMPTLVGVIQKMKETKVAPILAAMDARRAVALTEELTARTPLSSEPAPMAPTPAAARAPAAGAAAPRAN
jgi:flagellar motility protein MotE (MotC chaperone)